MAVNEADNGNIAFRKLHGGNCNSTFEAGKTSILHSTTVHTAEGQEKQASLAPSGKYRREGESGYSVPNASPCLGLTS